MNLNRALGRHLAAESVLMRFSTRTQPCENSWISVETDSARFFLILCDFRTSEFFKMEFESTQRLIFRDIRRSNYLFKITQNQSVAVVFSLVDRARTLP